MQNQNETGTMTIDLNRASSISDDELKEVMTYHPWSEEQIAKGQKVRDALAEAIRAIVENVPPSPDRSVAIRKLREARMDANSAITHNGKF